jgi:23S rRNA-/tRNA-specific pseudouridylate synthase
MTGAETLTLTVLQGGERLDRWLSAQLPQFSRSRLQKLIEGHQVWVNDQPVASKPRNSGAGTPGFIAPGDSPRDSLRRRPTPDSQ